MSILKDELLYYFISGDTNIMDWKVYGTETDIYISGLSLLLTDTVTKLPVYYVSIKAQNGAGLESQKVISTPIVVVNEDKPGILFICKIISL